MRDPADPTALANLAALLTGAACDRPRAHTLLPRAFDANPSDARVAAAYAPPAPPRPTLCCSRRGAARWDGATCSPCNEVPKST